MKFKTESDPARFMVDNEIGALRRTSRLAFSRGMSPATVADARRRIATAVEIVASRRAVSVAKLMHGLCTGFPPAGQKALGISPAGVQEIYKELAALV